MSARNNNNNSTSSKASKTSSSPVPNVENPIFIQVPLATLKKIKGCDSRCACRKAELDTRKSKATVRVCRIVGWFGVGSVAEKKNGSKNANKILKVNVTLESVDEDLKRKGYFDIHNHWFTFTNHAQDPNLAKYIGEFSLFAREKGFLDCLAFEDFKTKQWVVNPLDIERKKLENQPKKAEPRRKEIVEDLEDLDLFIDEPLKKTQAEDPKFVYNGESDSDSDLKDAESEEDEEAFDEKAFREELEKTEPIDISSDDDSEEGKNCASTLEQFKKESATAFAFTQNQPVEEEEDAFDDKTVETTDPTELVEDSVIANDKSVDATLEKTVPVEHSISETHTELVNIFASIMNDEPTEETKKLEEDYSFLLDFDFRRACDTTQKEVPQVVDVAEPIIQQVPVENKPEETIPVESIPMEVQPVESNPVEVQPEEEKPMEVESEKPTEPANDVQEARSETSAPVVETPVIEASATETLLVPAEPEQPKTPQKVLPVSGMELRKRKQPEKKDEKKATPHTSRRRAKNQ